MSSAEKDVDRSVFKMEGGDMNNITTKSIGESRPPVKDKDKSNDVEKAERHKKPIPCKK